MSQFTLGIYYYYYYWSVLFFISPLFFLLLLLKQAQVAQASLEFIMHLEELEPLILLFLPPRHWELSGLWYLGYAVLKMEPMASACERQAPYQMKPICMGIASLRKREGSCEGDFNLTLIVKRRPIFFF